ncbi:hypothetical protein [Nocardia wallacei]|uniref:hypothetical protein n=1 Tax=Nocardia wallacei TaxID=480035 RepID=UPI002458086D|nr:hypothetical protein [Nocardia wallacei]
MYFDSALSKVLADTRCADQIIRLSSDEIPTIAPGQGNLPDSFMHEWTHYFQFSTTPTGIYVSQYRRNCISTLRNIVLQHGADEVFMQPFIDRMDLFRSVWQSWPRHWHQLTNSEPKYISSATIRPDGLHVQLQDVEITTRLPLGMHALYEAYAWCASAFFGSEDLVGAIPREADLLIYTWPIWALADNLDRDVNQLTASDIVGLLPLLLIACSYHHPALPTNASWHTRRFIESSEILRERNVTVTLMVWQLLRDYQRFWNRPLSIGNVDSYLERVGVPSLSTVLELTAESIAKMSELSTSLLHDSQYSLQNGQIGYTVDQLAEIDILQATAANLAVLRNNIDGALISPLMLVRDLAPPVCAVERPNGYEWFSMTALADEPHPAWSDQTDSRILLREQLPIIEHMLMQLVFGSNLACYGPFDWRLPINPCPAAQECMSLTNKRGIEFCVDSAWRRKIAELVAAIHNYRATDPSEDDIPGITAATDEYRSLVRRILQGEQPPPTYDLSKLGINYPN